MPEQYERLSAEELLAWGKEHSIEELPDLQSLKEMSIGLVVREFLSAPRYQITGDESIILALVYDQSL
jgi:hypothetical protein